MTYNVIVIFVKGKQLKKKTYTYILIKDYTSIHNKMFSM